MQGEAVVPVASIADPIRIGSVLVPNRFVGAPTVMQHVGTDWNLTPAGIELYRERANGGVGLVVVEATAVESGGVIIGEPHPTLEREDQIPVMARCVEAIHEGGAKAFLQLVHAGRMSQNPVAPSLQLFYGIEPRVLTTAECHDIVRRFVRAARFTRAAGFDGVHLHAAHGWLLQQFLSPYTNRRTDEYGDRTLFLTRTMTGIKEACGADFPIAVRISADEYIGERGITLDWTRRVLVPAILGVNSLAMF